VFQTFNSLPLLVSVHYQESVSHICSLNVVTNVDIHYQEMEKTVY